MIERLIVLCRYLPDPTKSSGELRFWQILRQLRSRARVLTLFAEDPGNRHLFCEAEVYPMSALEAKAVPADLAFLEFWYMDLYLPTLRRRGIPVIMDSVDIEFLRREREKTIVGAGDGYYHAEKAREIASYRAADQVWAVSAVDAAQIGDFAANIVVVPNIFSPPAEVADFRHRAGVCFVGSYSHQPNVDGLRWYRDHIWPAVQDIAHTFVGHDAPDDLVALPGFVGGVDASAPHVAAARVSIVPLRYGAGLKGKLLEALACGTPIVTTAVGDEGYGAGAAGAAIVCDDPGDFGAAIRRIVDDERRWTGMSRCARALAGQYAPAAVAPIIDAALDSVLTATGRA
jgi:glycosyltransferase involved in cell wall biosynthesis